MRIFMHTGEHGTSSTMVSFVTNRHWSHCWTILDCQAAMFEFLIAQPDRNEQFAYFDRKEGDAPTPIGNARILFMKFCKFEENDVRTVLRNI